MIKTLKDYSTHFGFFWLAIFLMSVQCGKRNQKQVDTANEPDEISINKVKTNKGAYVSGEVVSLSYAINVLAHEDVEIRNIVVQFRNLSLANLPVIYERTTEQNFTVKKTAAHQFENAFWEIPSTAANTAYGVYVEYELESGQKKLSYQYFFRVVKPGDLTTFQIDRSSYNGLSVYALHGGMSSECAIAKSAENLTAGISHSWFVSAPGEGPEHVLATPQFLQNSVKQTVNFYNEAFGAARPIETVIIAPGIEPVPYLSKTMRAPVLPLHFLASAHTAKELQTVLDYSNENGYPSYATLGHDPSVAMAVAWVKLLQMPEEYLQFLKQHQVRNVVFIGYDGRDGETTARKVVNSAGNSLYEAGSLFILYPGGGSPSDNAALSQKILDFSTVAQNEQYMHIADWESGIIKEQLQNFSSACRQQANINAVRFMTADHMISLWDLASYLSLSFAYKNSLVSASAPLKGIVLNPYFVANPVYENTMNYLPVLYWQMNPAQETVNRLKTTIKRAITAYYPNINLSDLSVTLNSSRNFGGAAAAQQLKDALISNGINRIIENNYAEDDIWDINNGMTAPVEIKAVEMLSRQWTSAELMQWDNQSSALNMQDLDELMKKFPEIRVIKM